MAVGKEKKTRPHGTNVVDLRKKESNKSFLGVQGAIFQKSPLVAEGIDHWDAHKSGEIPRSRDMASAIGLLITLLFFAFLMPYLGKTMVLFMKKYLSSAGEWAVTPASASLFGRDFFKTYLQMVLPLMVMLIMVVVIVEVVQARGLKINTQNIKGKWAGFFTRGRMTRGLKRIFMPGETFTGLLKSLMQVVVIGFIAYFSLRGEMGIVRWAGLSLGEIVKRMGLVLLKLTFSITVFLLAFSVLEYLWQRGRYQKKSAMSGPGIREELKPIEEPGGVEILVKPGQQEISPQWTLRRMKAEVAGADVVITGPTCCAAAIKYDNKKMGSPQLVAKGKGPAAEEIEQAAREHHVPVVENLPVAQALYASVEMGALIPQELFKPVAEILANIYKLKGKRMV